MVSNVLQILFCLHPQQPEPGIYMYTNTLLMSSLHRAQLCSSLLAVHRYPYPCEVLSIELSSVPPSWLFTATLTLARFSPSSSALFLPLGCSPLPLPLRGSLHRAQLCSSLLAVHRYPYPCEVLSIELSSVPPSWLFTATLTLARFSPSSSALFLPLGCSPLPLPLRGSLHRAQLCSSLLAVHRYPYPCEVLSIELSSVPPSWLFTATLTLARFSPSSSALFLPLGCSPLPLPLRGSLRTVFQPPFLLRHTNLLFVSISSHPHLFSKLLSVLHCPSTW